MDGEGGSSERCLKWGGEGGSSERCLKWGGVGRGVAVKGA